MTASSLMGLHDVQKIDMLQQIFRDGTRLHLLYPSLIYSLLPFSLLSFSLSSMSESSLIILDDLHRLVEYVQVGQRISVSHPMMHYVSTLLSTIPPPGQLIGRALGISLSLTHSLSLSLSLSLPLPPSLSLPLSPGSQMLVLAQYHSTIPMSYKETIVWDCPLSLHGIFIFQK